MSRNVVLKALQHQRRTQTPTPASDVTEEEPREGRTAQRLDDVMENMDVSFSLSTFCAHISLTNQNKEGLSYSAYKYE